MVKGALTGLHIPSVRRELTHSRSGHHHHQISAKSRSINVSYPTGSSALQVSGLHVRLSSLAAAAAEAATAKMLATLDSSVAAGSSSSPHSAAAAAEMSKEANRAGASKFQHFGGTSSAEAEAKEKAARLRQQQQLKHLHAMAQKADAEEMQGSLPVTVIVRAQVRGDLAMKAREFVVAVVPLCFGNNNNNNSESSSSDAAEKEKEAARPVAYDKRVKNAMEREKQRLQPAVVGPSAFIPLDIRVQVEKLKLIVEVVEGIDTNSFAKSGGKFGKRKRDGKGENEEDEEAAALDCALDVTVCGAVSALA